MTSPTHTRGPRGRRFAAGPGTLDRTRPNWAVSALLRRADRRRDRHQARAELRTSMYILAACLRRAA